MKLVIFLAVASVAVMLVVVYQVVRQEMTKNYLKTLAQDTAIEISRKENAITELKTSLQGLKPKLLSMTKMTEELKAKKDALQNEKKTLQENVKTCNKEKGESETKKAETTDNLSKQKGDHELAKENAQTTIQDLKQQNLDREKAICALVDTTNADARKLCGL